ncbi:MAG: septal ring lytic transglycosylase RlpA family protein [Hydrogenophaga sp.]|uniref:septal ring lytic transglycosylase RlpA family protein n=1 Tax=Hydrogenophaga sp. TaxID=1904254 RepID=UPI003D9B5B16
MPHSSRRLIRSRPRPRTASALLAFALAGCAVPHKAPAPVQASTAPLAPSPASQGRPEPVVASAVAHPRAPASLPPIAPLGEPLVLIAPLDGGETISAADAQQAALDAKSGKPLAQGLASWYGPGFHGRRTANGERYDMHALTAAHKTLPFGTKVRVRSVYTGKEVVVRINDRGPYKHSRIIDLSLGAISALGLRHRGVTEVVLLRE